MDQRPAGGASLVLRLQSTAVHCAAQNSSGTDDWQQGNEARPHGYLEESDFGTSCELCNSKIPIWYLLACLIVFKEVLVKKLNNLSESDWVSETVNDSKFQPFTAARTGRVPSSGGQLRWGTNQHPGGKICDPPQILNQNGAGMWDSWKAKAILIRLVNLFHWKFRVRTAISIDIVYHHVPHWKWQILRYTMVYFFRRTQKWHQWVTGCFGKCLLRLATSCEISSI